MSTSPCTPHLPRLSALLDGALSPAEQAELEGHLAECGDCSVRLADLAVGSQALRSHFESAADQVDWKGFTAKVMAQVEPARPSLLERAQQWMDSLFPQRGWGLVAAGALGMALVMGVGYLGFGGRAEGPGYGADKMAVKQVQTDSTVMPVVNESEQGSIIWLVDHPQAAAPDAEKVPDAGTPKASDEEGEL